MLFRILIFLYRALLSPLVAAAIGTSFLLVHALIPTAGPEPWTRWLIPPYSRELYFFQLPLGVLAYTAVYILLRPAPAPMRLAGRADLTRPSPGSTLRRNLRLPLAVATLLPLWLMYAMNWAHGWFPEIFILPPWPDLSPAMIAAAMLIALSVPQPKLRVSRASLILAFFGLCFVALMLVHFVHLPEAVGQLGEVLRRYSTPYKHKIFHFMAGNTEADMLAFGFCPVLFWLLRSHSHPVLKRLAAFALTGALSAVLVLNGTRTVLWLVLPGILGIFFWFTAQRKVIVAALAGWLICLGTLAVLTTEQLEHTWTVVSRTPEAMQSRNSLREMHEHYRRDSYIFRLRIWAFSMKYLIEHRRYLGFGQRAVNRIVKASGGNPTRKPPHNFFVYSALAYGAPGLALFVLSLAALGVRLVRIALREPGEKLLSGTLFSMAFAFLVTISYSNLQFSYYLCQYLLFLCCVEMLYRVRAEDLAGIKGGERPMPDLVFWEARYSPYGAILHRPSGT